MQTAGVRGGNDKGVARARNGGREGVSTEEEEAAVGGGKHPPRLKRWPCVC